MGVVLVLPRASYTWRLVGKLVSASFFGGLTRLIVGVSVVQGMEKDDRGAIRMSMDYALVVSIGGGDRFRGNRVTPRMGQEFMIWESDVDWGEGTYIWCSGLSTMG